MMMQKLYSKTKIAGLAVVALSFFTALTASAQIKLGNNGTNIQPSALLELESTNRGLLIPRMPNTVAIDALNPPEGMVVFITTEPNSGLHIKKASGWERLQGYLNGVASFTSLTVTGAVTAGSFSGPLTGNATTATTAATATNAINSQVTNDVATTAITYPVFVGATPGFQPLRTGSGNLSYVPSTGILTARGFNGPLVGNVTGNATTAADAENAVNIRITDDVNSATPMYPTFVNGTTGPIPARVSSTKLSFIPSSGELTATRFRGALDGNATSATNVTGVVNAVNGGTGFAVYTPGDILYSDASNTLAKLAIGTPGTILRVDPNRRPVWSTAGAGTVINVSGTSNRIVVTDPTVSPQIDIDANYVGQNSITTLGTIATGTWNGSTISTLHGGTGVTNLTANEILIGRGPGVSIGSISLVNTQGKVLTSNGPNALPSFEAPGVGDMILGTVQTVTGGKIFNDGTLSLNGSISGSSILKAAANATGTITFPAGPATLVSLTGTETLDNKTLSSPNITGTGTFQTLNGAQLSLDGGTPLTTTNRTGSGRLVLENTPTLITPNIGQATGLSLNVSGTVTATGGLVGTASNTNNVGARNAADVVTGVDLANAATHVSLGGTIVRRDGAQNFAANEITANNFIGDLTGNISGNAATVTTNADLTGQVTSSGNVTTIQNNAVIQKVLTGFTSGSGTVAAADNILQAIQKLDGNVALRAPLANPTFTGGITTPNITLGATLLTPTPAQFNFLTGVTSSVQTQLNGKQAALTTSADLAGVLNDETGNTAPGVVVFNNSPAFINNPTAPTQSAGNNSTRLATTEFVQTAVGMLRFQAVLGNTTPNIAAGTEVEIVYTTAGAPITATVVVSPTQALPADLGIMSARVSAVGEVSVKYRNFGAGTINNFAVDLNITVIR